MLIVWTNPEITEDSNFLEKRDLTMFWNRICIFFRGVDTLFVNVFNVSLNI